MHHRPSNTTEESAADAAHHHRPADACIDIRNNQQFWSGNANFAHWWLALIFPAVVQLKDKNWPPLRAGLPRVRSDPSDDGDEAAHAGPAAVRFYLPLRNGSRFINAFMDVRLASCSALFGVPCLQVNRSDYRSDLEAESGALIRCAAKTVVNVPLGVWEGPKFYTNASCFADVAAMNLLGRPRASVWRLPPHVSLAPPGPLGARPDEIDPNSMGPRLLFLNSTRGSGSSSRLLGADEAFAELRENSLLRDRFGFEVVLDVRKVWLDEHGARFTNVTVSPDYVWLERAVLKNHGKSYAAVQSYIHGHYAPFNSFWQPSKDFRPMLLRAHVLADLLREVRTGARGRSRGATIRNRR